MLIKQYQTIPYTRFSGRTEARWSLELTMARRVWDQLWIEFAVSRLWWDNAGFQPTKPEAATEGDIEKFTISAGFYYNFDLPGYNITRMLNR